jgi:hypothetical protein
MASGAWAWLAGGARSPRRTINDTGKILLVFWFKLRLWCRTGKALAVTLVGAPGPSKERAMLTVLIVVSVIAFAALYIGRRSRRP